MGRETIHSLFDFEKVKIKEAKGRKEKIGEQFAVAEKKEEMDCQARPGPGGLNPVDPENSSEDGSKVRKGNNNEDPGKFKMATETKSKLFYFFIAFTAFLVLVVFVLILVQSVKTTPMDEQISTVYVPSTESTTEAPTAKTAKNCETKQFSHTPYCNPAFIGDEFCDASCNVPYHNYDGGDCCSIANMTYDFCNYDDCECYCYPEDKQYEESNMLEVSITIEIPENQCISCVSLVYLSCNYYHFIGDGICDARCNILNPDNDDDTTGDDWDGGDCCNSQSNFEHCPSECCECLCNKEGK